MLHIANGSSRKNKESLPAETPEQNWLRPWQRSHWPELRACSAFTISNRQINSLTTRNRRLDATEIHIKVALSTCLPHFLFILKKVVVSPCKINRNLLQKFQFHKSIELHPICFLIPRSVMFSLTVEASDHLPDSEYKLANKTWYPS